MFQSWWGVFLLTMHYVQVGIYSNDTYIKAYKKLCMLLLKRQCLKQTKNKKQQKLKKKLNLNSYTVIFLSFYWFKNYGCVFKHLKITVIYLFFASHYFKDQKQDLCALTKWITEKHTILWK